MVMLHVTISLNQHAMRQLTLAVGIGNLDFLYLLELGRGHALSANAWHRMPPCFLHSPSDFFVTFHTTHAILYHQRIS